MVAFERSNFRLVDAPPEYANSALNGSLCLPVFWHRDGGVTVLLLTGPHAGREWQLMREHIGTPFTD